MGLLGLLSILALAYALSRNRRAIKPSLVLWGLGLQILLAVLVLKTPFGAVFQALGGAINRMMHTLLQLGPTPEADELALQEVALRGLLMHGVPPRTAEEWRRAGEVFDDEALAEFRRWASGEAAGEQDGVGANAGERAG